MRFGLSLPHYGFSLPDGAPITFEAMAHWARRAERLGFDTVWVSDHLFYSFGRYGVDPAPIAAIEPLTALAGLAAVTEEIRMGTLVLGAPFRHPAIVAKMASTIDAMSEGRLELGVGAGWLEEEFGAFGYRFGSTGDRFDTLEHTLHVLRALFFGGPVTLDDGVCRLEEAHLAPAPVGGIPLWVGGKGGPRSLRLAARYADGWNSVWRWSPDDYAARAADARVACEREGRDPTTFRFTVGLYSLLAESDAGFTALFERARAAMPGDALRREDEASWRSDTLSGTPEQAIERVHAFETIGVEEIVVAPWVLPFAIPEPGLVDLFAERVIAPMRAVGARK